jgi:hypothetical protein
MYLEWKGTALGAASRIGNSAIAEYLLAQGAPMTICTAAMLGLKNEVERFLRAARNQARATGAHDLSVLYHTAISGSTEIAALLEQHGAVE